MPRSEPGIALAPPLAAAAFEEVNRHLDTGLTEYEVLRPLLAQAEVAAQRISSGLSKARLREHVAERDTLRSRVDATPVGLASLASELRWTTQRREDRTQPHRTRALLDERATRAAHPPRPGPRH